MKFPKVKSSYQFNGLGYGLYFGSLAIVLLLILFRAARQPLPLLGKYALYDHISNFTISYTYLLSLGGGWLYKKSAWKSIFVTAGFLVIINIIVETVIKYGNTPDPLDAFAGILGVVSALLILGCLYRYGSYKSDKGS